jgi:uracil-DNA glycosylase
VLLLNAVLTVERGLAGSHANKGWEGFTDACIDALNRDREHLVFLLWGAYAQKKGSLIDRQRHLVLKAPHPSPLARGGFDGCGHFSKTNEYLKAHGGTPIDWRLPSRNELEPA